LFFSIGTPISENKQPLFALIVEFEKRAKPGRGSIERVTIARDGSLTSKNTSIWNPM